LVIIGDNNFIHFHDLEKNPICSIPYYLVNSIELERKLEKLDNVDQFRKDWDEMMNKPAIETIISKSDNWGGGGNQ